MDESAEVWRASNSSRACRASFTASSSVDSQDGMARKRCRTDLFGADLRGANVPHANMTVRAGQILNGGVRLARQAWAAGVQVVHTALR